MTSPELLQAACQAADSTRELARLLPELAMWRPSGESVTISAEDWVKLLAGVARARANAESVVERLGRAEPLVEEKGHVEITWDISHVQRTARFLTENDYPHLWWSLGRRNGEIARLGLDVELTLSFYRTGLVIIEGRAKCDHERERASVKNLLREDCWVV